MNRDILRNGLSCRGGAAVVLKASDEGAMLLIPICNILSERVSERVSGQVPVPYRRLVS